MVLVTPAPLEASNPSSPDAKKTGNLKASLAKDAARRLVEYIVVVSSVPRNKDNPDDAQQQQQELSQDWGEDDVVYDDYDFQPIISARYPLEDHTENPLHESTTFFCHPSGIQLRAEPSMPKIHYFVATGGTGRQMYGVCMTLWEPYMILAKRTSPKKVREETEMEVYLPKCVVILSMYPYLIAFREYLTQLNRLSKMGEMTLPLERYIANFVAEIPAPPPGSFEVQTTLLDSVIRIWSPPHNQPIAWVSLPFSHLFECLDIDNIVLVWHCLALERQVLLTSTQLSLLTECAEILLSMLFPMRWSHAYIPVLPHFLIPILSAPMPFLCGIHKGNLADALCDLSRECVVVDLDKNLVTLGPDTASLPPLPPQMKNTLVTRLEENVGMIFRAARSLRKNDDYSGSGENLQPHVKLTADAMWEGRLCLFDEAFHLFFTPEESRKNLLNGNDTSGMDSSDRDGGIPVHIITNAEKQNMRKQSTWDAVQEAFLDCYVYLLRNCRKFLVYPSKENEGSYGGAGFRSREFVQTQRYDMQPFLEELIATQMFDNFVTKRLYGSGEADVTFFDMAVDRFLKNQGLLSSGGRMIRGWRAASGDAQKASSTPDQGPLLQSARVHRKLKTIVPPEPSNEGLPPHPGMTQHEGGPVVTAITEDASEVADDLSVNSSSTYGTQSTSRSNNNNKSPNNKQSKSIQDRAAEILDKSKYRYTYETFPSEFDVELFGTPRPLPSAVIAEFDRQKKDAARFRRKKSVKHSNEKSHLKRTGADADAPPSAEVATFTLFFMAFSAVVGKELLEIHDNPLLAQDRPILATYVHPHDDSDVESDLGTDSSVPTTIATSTNGHHADESFEDALDDMSVSTDTAKKGARPGDSDDDEFVEAREELEPTKKRGSAKAVCDPSKPRSRFRDSLSALQIEEAKATGRAQLALAFEMLTMMKKRGLKADPEAYQCLIDACGRIGDTQRATELLAKMHEDGIVADGVVYSCLVSAFSADTAWKQPGTKNEELPEWANSTSIEMDWNKLHKKTSIVDSAKKQLAHLAGKSEDEDDDIDSVGSASTPYQRLRRLVARKQEVRRSSIAAPSIRTLDNMQFFITEAVEMQIELGENLLEIVYPDISVDTDNETCPRCNFLLSDDDVVAGWTPSDSQDYTTSCPNCTQRFVPHFHVQSTSATFMGSRGPASPLLCERLSPWVLQKEIRTVMADREGIENLLSPEWRETENKNAVLWWNLVLSCMRYRFLFTFILQGSFDQSLIAPMPEHDN